VIELKNAADEKGDESGLPSITADLSGADSRLFANETLL